MVDEPIDVFSDYGEYIGTLAADLVFPVAFLAGKRIAVIEIDAQDVDRLVVLAIEEEP